MLRLPFSPPTPTPGPSRLFLYAKALALLLLGGSLLFAYIERYPPLSQAGGSFYQVAKTRQATDGDAAAEDGAKKTFIKWVDFTVTSEAMDKALDLDIATFRSDPHLNWIELLAYLGARYGGDFSRYKAADLDKLAQSLNEGSTMGELTKDMKYYDYYLEAYTAVLGGMVGTYQEEVPAGQMPSQADSAVGPFPSQAGNSVGQLPAAPSQPAVDNEDPKAGGPPKAGEPKAEELHAEGQETTWVTKYGLKAFSPIAKGFPYSEFDDFGTARSYGFKRQHLGHDMMGQVGTPIIAVESGTVEALGWNQYGGWRIGIRSFDKKRYYYYAHLRKGYPYQSDLKEGGTVQAGDVIGYMGRTGYSRTEDTNNIDESHLHFGLQLIFDESQKDGNNEIWISCYELVRFRHQHQSQTQKIPDTKEWRRVYRTKDLPPFS